MKTFILLICFSTISYSLCSQTAFRKSYYFPDSINIKKKINKAKRTERTFLCKKSSNWEIDTTIHLRWTDTTGSKPIDSIAYLNRAHHNYAINNCPELLKGNVKLDKNKLYINPWFIDDTTRNRDYFYKLQNRQMVKLRYQQVTFTAITIPLKVQFGKDSSVNYQTGISIGALIGYSRGRTRYTYRSQLGNFERSGELTIGALINVSSIEFKDDFNRTKKTAAVAIGGAFMYSYESLSFGVSGGIEYATGSQSNDWNFNGRPWLGIMLGYSLFDK